MVLLPGHQIRELCLSFGVSLMLKVSFYVRHQERHCTVTAICVYIIIAYWYAILMLLTLLSLIPALRGTFSITVTSVCMCVWKRERAGNNIQPQNSPLHNADNFKSNLSALRCWLACAVHQPNIFITTWKLLSDNNKKHHFIQNAWRNQTYNPTHAKTIRALGPEEVKWETKSLCCSRNEIRRLLEINTPFELKGCT